MRILITGGNGFIARHLTTRLTVHHTVDAPGRSALDLLDSDAVAARLKAGRYDVVIHAATYDAAPRHSPKDPAKVLENNVKMFFNIARRQTDFGRMIYFGSGAEFSRAHWHPKMAESFFDEHLPSDPYGLSKYVMNLHANRPGSRIFNLRLFGVFGEDDDWRTRFLSNACCRAVLDMPIVMNQNRVFDHLYIQDLTAITEWFLTATPRYNTYNVCSGSTHDFLSLARMVCEVSGKPLALTVKCPGLGLEYSGDNARLLAELGSFSFTPIQTAIAAVYAWHERNQAHLLKSEL